ncbi:MAG TPA: methyltransferase domain-containing protein [Thermomicrobiales bacterium]|nr:methyltransferase domain-containing protein [Thermomicrobiales bacterium]
MAADEVGELDRWADWLLRGRQRGLSAAQVRRQGASLRRFRDWVLRGARLRAGQRVLDVGAGTGLVALAARRRVGPGGRVVAFDRSRDALRECRRQGADDPGASLRPVAGDAACLPFRDGAFDAVLTRSVLIYVADKSAAAREIYRVLRPGGRASLFEPINSATQQYWVASPDLAPVQPAHDRILAQLNAGFTHRADMVGFDERDLLQYFIEAGFVDVRLDYEFRHALRRRAPAEIAASLQARPNPSMLSYEEAARAVLGAAADEYLARYVRLLVAQPRVEASAVAYLTAEKGR